MNNSIFQERLLFSKKTGDDDGLKSLRYCEKLEILGILRGGGEGSIILRRSNELKFFAGFNFSVSLDEVLFERFDDDYW